MILSLLIDLGSLGGVRVVRLDGRWLNQGRIGGLRRRLKVGVLVGIGASGCSLGMLTMRAEPADSHSHLCITRYAADTAEKEAGDEGLSVYGLKADFNVGLGICGQESARHSIIGPMVLTRLASAMLQEIEQDSCAALDERL